MRLGKKSLFIIAAMWVSFISIVLISTTSWAVGGFLTTAIFSSVLLFWWQKFTVIKPLKHLIQQLTEINITNSFSKRIQLNSHDEFESISSGINKILDSAQLTQEKQEEHLNEQLHELQLINQELKSELAELKPVAGKPINKIDYAEQMSHKKHPQELPNRIYFNEILNKSIQHARRHKQTLAILLVDICHLKQINTELGQTKTNLLLKEVSNRLEKTLRLEDIIAKLENDGFIILLNKIDKPQFASIVSEKLLKSLSQSIKLDNDELTVTANIGICTYPNDGNTLEELLSNIDKALYKSKSKGENTYQFYSQEINNSASAYIQMEKALRSAIINNELTLYYQPKLHLKRGTVVSLEALLRWINPNLGMIYPLQFISIADETGFFLPLAEWVIREAVKMNKYWQDEGYAHMTVSVNLSSKQFHHPEMPNIISRALEDYQLNPRYLEIELDEKTVMEDVTLSSAALFAIKATGIRITIDHFGTGYTSISYLKKFPISVIKIDSSFIKGIPTNPNDSAITNAFIALSHQLGIEVVAQGVETSEQVQYLSEKNCDMVQGYFLSHPLPADKIKSQLPKLSEEVLI